MFHVFKFFFFKLCVCLCSQSLSHVQLFVTPRTVAFQAPLSMEFSRQVYWSSLPFPSAGDLPNSGLEPASFTSPALTGRFFTTSATWDTHEGLKICPLIPPVFKPALDRCSLTVIAKSGWEKGPETWHQIATFH